MITLALVGGAWELFAINSPGLLIPRFSDTVLDFVMLFTNMEVWDALLLSNRALVLGFGLSVIVGIPLGLLLGRIRVLQCAADPYIDILMVLPMAAIIPLLVMSIGIGIWSRVVLIFSFAVPVVLVDTLVGVKQIRGDMIEMSRCFGATERQVWRFVLVRAAMPSIMTGVRVGLGRAINGMVIAELLMVAVGIGALILNARGTFNPAHLYAVVVLTVLQAALLISLARWVERKITPPGT